MLKNQANKINTLIVNTQYIAFNYKMILNKIIYYLPKSAFFFTMY